MKILGNTTFDEIYVNPPFIAVPQDWNFPIAGNGGEKWFRNYIEYYTGV